jgi:hypothetical protein
MWEESKHPRDDEGKFTTKGGYQSFLEKRKSVGWTDGEAVPERKYDIYTRLLGTDEGLEYLPRVYFTGNPGSPKDLRQRIEDGKESLANKGQSQTNTLRETDGMKEIRQATNATLSAAKRIESAAVRARVARDEAIRTANQNRGQSGYAGKSKSIRAESAESEGKFPLSKAAQILGVTTIKIKQHLSPSEWHHTGALYNVTYYYDIADICDIASDLIDWDNEYIRENYSAESIRDFENIFGVKIK